MHKFVSKPVVTSPLTTCEQSTANVTFKCTTRGRHLANYSRGRPSNMAAALRASPASAAPKMAAAEAALQAGSGSRAAGPAAGPGGP